METNVCVCAVLVWNTCAGVCVQVALKQAAAEQQHRRHMTFQKAET